MRRPDGIPVIDLFAGPGGLGEGFSACLNGDRHPYDVRLSIEKDVAAHQTLELRAFYRQFVDEQVPESYYQHIRGGLSREDLYARHPEAAAAARKEARLGELGSRELSPQILDKWVVEALGGSDNWVLIGGPPCQAYSVAGRSRRKGVKGYALEKDPRHDLYRQYLRVISRHWPSVFVMENVKGLLSSRIGGDLILNRILDDLSDPAAAVDEKGAPANGGYQYKMYSLVETTQPGLDGVPLNPASDFLIEAEKFGIPQARHRVILLGVRDDIRERLATLKSGPDVTAADVLEGLPRLRSGLSRDQKGRHSRDADGRTAWKATVREALTGGLRKAIRECGGNGVLELMEKIITGLHAPKHDRGAEFVACSVSIRHRPDWFLDPRLKGTCNSTTRQHLAGDLHRYLYAACFAQVHGRSPRLRDFPEKLWPEHRNVGRSLKFGNFSDRFRVQLKTRPATTVVSHIAKDGHYYIHYDPSQARSLTVREAARLQTFPDNYFFCGNRTEQYTQVGNAVPPLLALQIAELALDLVSTGESDGRRAIA